MGRVKTSQDGRGGQLITPAARERIAKRNRALLDDELLAKKLAFESRPYEAHIQFSNVCNISCIMCWDGDNPPAKKMSPELLDKVATQLGPHLSVITPHEASEPTIVTWDETVAIARAYSTDISLTTNMQEFDEEKFHQVKDLLEVVVMSIDSHVPEVFEKIRLGAKADKVFRNAETIARLCREHGIECIGHVVFMTENAPMMPETVAWLADIGVAEVSVAALNDTNRRSWHLDAALHYSAEYLDWIKNRCIAAAKEKHVRLGWFLSSYEKYRFDEEGAAGLKESKAWNERWDSLMQLRHPGYCRFAYDRLRVDVEGRVSPCGLDSHHELQLGNLNEEDFEDMWNGPTARDLRRAHYTGDHPSLCKTCRFADRQPPRESMRFLGSFLWTSWQIGPGKVPASLPLLGPDHMLRTIEPPAIRLGPHERLAPYLVVIALAGQPGEVQVFGIDPIEAADGSIELPIPIDRWERLRTNVGYWWTVLGFNGLHFARPVARTPEIRCVIRHEPIPRIEGSRLKYPDQGHFAPVYLGGEREVGWKERGKLPARPPLSGVGMPKSAGEGPRFAKLRKVHGDGDQVNGQMSREVYDELIGQIRAVVNSALPADASIVVVTKGDPQLLYFDGRPAWHFPSDSVRDWAGFHPPDSDWAIGHLERMRDEGAEFLLLPTVAHWWLDHYHGFAQHLRTRYPAIVEDRERCTIFDLREPLDVPRRPTTQNGAAP